MAERGDAATTISALSQETGVAKSAIYHHFHSKGGLLSAVMARGAYDFFQAMAEAQTSPPQTGTPRERLGWHLPRAGEVFMSRTEFLRLHLLLLMTTEAAEAEVGAIIAQVRLDGRAHMNRMIAASFAGPGAENARAVADELDAFAMAGFDGAFITWQADRSRTLSGQLELVTDAVAALGEAVLARRGG